MDAGLESIAQDNALFSKSSWDASFIGSDKVDIQLPGEYTELVTGTTNRVWFYLFFFCKRLHVCFLLIMQVKMTLLCSRWMSNWNISQTKKLASLSVLIHITHVNHLFI